VGICGREFLLGRRVCRATADARISWAVPFQSKDGETYELQWTFDVRFLADEPYHSLTPLQPSERNPFPWEEAPEKPERASQEAGSAPA
jgi:hypothetical protein